jgi:hypothetical protein
MHEMQVNIWDLTDENAEIIRSVLKDPKQQLTLNQTKIENIRSTS